MPDNLIEIRGLTKYYPVFGGLLRRKVAEVKALDGVDLGIARGECLGLVGESGCGKTTLGKTLLRLHPATSGRIYYGQSAPAVAEREAQLASPDAGIRTRAQRALRDGLDLVHASGRALMKLRQKIQIVFQDPTNSLDPRMLIRDIVTEPLVSQRLIRRDEVEARALALLETVGLTRDHLLRYPHEFSGGQRQRVAIARALATSPEFILMDEPTSALDVSVQAQILNLLKSLQQSMGLTFLFVTHHLLVVKYISNRVAVMYLGKIVELAPTAELFERPLHPYTKALLSAIPVPDPESQREKIVLTGEVPNPINPPQGCRFHPRCAFATDLCRREEPLLRPVGTGSRTVACHHWEKLEARA